ncbi:MULTISPECIES: hypothetical protein [Cytobacillus]|uniref:Uncharacterized protein n=1 Tax=Cytobacillus firmus TaxID=1399 RepID=A0AA46PAT9_CYTFI|nr:MULTISPECIES: hypothetical protein [Cytobacillus]MDF2039351.1 hypothetical protein [Cytobacillus oceanisediminis]UYG96751.1 hypothetical protein OD459_06895 [Cytobacillus firmus]
MSTPTKATEKIMAFIEEYKSKVNQLNEKIAATSQEMDDMKMEARFIREKELPEASVKRVLEGETAHEAKLAKKLEKLEADILAKQEELLILNKALQQFKLQSAEGLKQFHQLFIDERKIATDKAYSKMMNAKRAYVETMKAESELLHQYQAIDVQMQEIELEAGLRKDIYNILPLNAAPIQGHLNRHNGVYLALPNEDVQKIIKKKRIDLGYLDKFKHSKSL